MITQFSKFQYRSRSFCASCLIGVFGSIFFQNVTAVTIEDLRAYSLAELPSKEDSSNRYLNNVAAISIGESLFFDQTFSKSGALSCASCHVTADEFVPNENVPAGKLRRWRTVMPLDAVAYAEFFFWDGRADSLWAQALEPLENQEEHALTRTEVAQFVLKKYGDFLHAELPIVADIDIFSLPPASPVGTALQKYNWDVFSEVERETVNRIFALTGKLLAAYQSSLNIKKSQWDSLLAKALSLDSIEEIPSPLLSGFSIFIGKGQCARCHSGPLFTDHDFHNTGLPIKKEKFPDLGRQRVIEKIDSLEFGCLSKYSDAAPESCLHVNYVNKSMAKNLYAFKTPTLRGVKKRTQLGHSGQIDSLRAMIEHYNNPPELSNQSDELKPLGLTEPEKRSLEMFLRSL